MANWCCGDHVTGRCCKSPTLFHLKRKANPPEKLWKALGLYNFCRTVCFRIEHRQGYRRCGHSPDLESFGGPVLKPTFQVLRQVGHQGNYTPQLQKNWVMRQCEKTVAVWLKS